MYVKRVSRHRLVRVELMERIASQLRGWQRHLQTFDEEKTRDVIEKFLHHNASIAIQSQYIYTRALYTVIQLN